MPLGFNRFNERRQRPNRWINFIKPIKGSDEVTSLDFLERIAAICRPICEEHHINIMSLEEFEANREFVGRNFNNGEVIQLVLKSRSGHWLPFQFVQMVMMHEMAHCKHMNHSKAFWKVRDQYAGRLRELWQNDYTGDGFWSKGLTLYDGQYTTSSMPSADIISNSICGGIYRSRGKRKRSKPRLTYAEKKARRIQNKFGIGGIALGADIEMRQGLEDGKRVKGQPRAKGTRGRDLRAAAALARFDQSISGENETDQRDGEFEIQSESEYDDPEDQQNAIDLSGKEMLDPSGQPLIKVCEANAPSAEAHREAMELGSMDQYIREKSSKNQIFDFAATEASHTVPGSHETPLNSFRETPRGKQDLKLIGKRTQKPVKTSYSSVCSPPEAIPGTLQCPICSLSNESNSITCAACAHVLQEDKLRRCWRCQTVSCTEIRYLNTGDCATCGACGMPRPSKAN